MNQLPSKIVEILHMVNIIGALRFKPAASQMRIFQYTFSEHADTKANIIKSSFKIKYSVLT